MTAPLQSRPLDAPPLQDPAWDPVLPDRRLKRRVFAGVALALAILAFVNTWPRAQVAAPDRHLSDFTCYTAAGRAIFAGEDPYLASNPRGWRYLYPPPFAMLVAPLAPLHPQTQALVWFAISALLVFACYGELVRLLRAALDELGPLPSGAPAFPDWLRWTPFASVFLYGITTLELGQVSILLLYLVLLGSRLVLLGRRPFDWIAGGGFLAAAVVVKLVPALVVVALFAALLLTPRRPGAIASPRRRALALAGGFLAGIVVLLLLLPAALVGWEANARHLASFREHVLATADLTHTASVNDVIPGNQSFGIATRKLGNWILSRGAILPPATFEERPPSDAPMSTPAAGLAVGLSLLLLLALLAAAGWRLAQNGTLLAYLVLVGIASAASLVLSPISWSHGFVLLAPAVLFAPLWLHRAGHRRAAVIVAAVPLAVELAHYLLRSSFRLVGGLGVGIAAWLVLISVLVIVLPAPRLAAATSAI